MVNWVPELANFAIFHHFFKDNFRYSRSTLDPIIYILNNIKGGGGGGGGEGGNGEKW